MNDRQFAISGRWALATDGVQWILQRRGGVGWRPVSFVHSTRDILRRCMREKGCPWEDAQRLLAGLPSTFDEWSGKRGGRPLLRALSDPRHPDSPPLGEMVPVRLWRAMSGG